MLLWQPMQLMVTNDPRDSPLDTPLAKPDTLWGEHFPPLPLTSVCLPLSDGIRFLQELRLRIRLLYLGRVKLVWLVLEGWIRLQLWNILKDSLVSNLRYQMALQEEKYVAWKFDRKTWIMDFDKDLLMDLKSDLNNNSLKNCFREY